MSQTQPLTEAMTKVADLALALKAQPLNQYPGLWEYRFGDWTLYVNGHRMPMATAGDVLVSPFNAYVERQGWPVMIFDGFGGTVVGDGEDAFLAALDAEILRVRQGEPAITIDDAHGRSPQH